MRPLFNSNLTVEQFLSDYWQKKPLLIRQAFPGFVPELDINDIAGLACEDLVESRLISGAFPDHNWVVEQGPFSEKRLTLLPESDWTLLVQDVEKHYPPVQELFEALAFLPKWRFDDLMVSVAAPGGSVGPHVDEYDVFLLQAQGKRTWQIASRFEPDLLADSELKVLRNFKAEQEWTLEPGDLLYLPPGVAHYGVAQDTGMTWSFGTRAPSSADLFQSFGEWLAIQKNEGHRYLDQELDGNPLPGEVDLNALTGLQQMLQQSLGHGAEFNRFVAAFLSTYRLAHQPAGPEQVYYESDVRRELTADKPLLHNPWTRLLWIRVEDSALLFAAGQAHPCSVDLARAICSNPVESLAEAAAADDDVRLICTLLNQGHLVFE